VSISAGPLSGSYTQDDVYSATGDMLDGYYDTAAGNLPAEAVTLGYNSVGQPDHLSSPDGTYVETLSYTNLDQPQSYLLDGGALTLRDLYSDATGRLTSTGVLSSAQGTLDGQSYTYDNDGLITSESDVPPSGPSQVQCFTYDYLGRLASAWSQGTATCPDTPSQADEATAAAPYSESYGYNDENDLTSVTSTPPSGSATTVTSSFPRAGSARPHAVTAQHVTGPAGSSTVSYAYDASGHTTSITSPASGRSLHWNAVGELSSVAVTKGAGLGATSYVYDADGSLLLQTGPGGTTLYLPDEQITRGHSGTVTAVRYYSIGGVTIAARTSVDDLAYLAGNQQGTDTLALAAGGSQIQVTRRYYDPYGNPVGKAPGSWPGTRGFVGGITQTTGLDVLGARQYNPATASFISPDPLISPYNPQDLNAYAYAADDPATLSDPTGQSLPYPDPCGVDEPNCGPGYARGNGGGGQGGSGGYSGGRTDPYGYYAPYGDELAPVFGPPPIEVITRTPRAVTPRQDSTGLPACESGRAGALEPGPCQVAPVGPSGHAPLWLTAGVLVAGGVVLTVVNVVQLGADPVTDGAEVADVGALTGELTATVGEPTAGAGSKWALELAEKASEDQETTMDIHDLTSTGSQSLEDLFGPHPSTGQAMVDAGGGFQAPIPPAIPASGSPLESAALVLTMGARVLYDALQQALQR